MIRLPGTREPAYADSTGKIIRPGDRIRFRGKVYTLKEIGPEYDLIPGVNTLIFNEKLHTAEVPHECNVDRVGGGNVDDYRGTI